MGLDPGHAEEVAQEAFVVFLQKQEKVELGKEDAFILSTTVRLCQNLRRKSYRFHEQLVSLEDLESHSDEVSTQQLMEQKQAREVIDGILCRMSDPLRMVFVLHELEQLTLQEIAEFLEIPTGTACSRLRLARAAFAKELELQNQANLATLEAP
jgi:RNA polymerase sigma-70 factor (ECF subfamily)